MRNIRLAALAAALLVLRPGAARASKLDARLRVRREVAAHLMTVAGASAKPASYRVLIRTAPGTTPARLRSAYPGARFGSSAGGVVTAVVGNAELDAFETDPSVLGVEAARRLHPNLDVVRGNATNGGNYLGTTRNGAALDLSTATGAGVIVGVVDTGLDFRHKDFVDPATGHSRVKDLWDQTDSAGPAPSGISCTTDCGTEWSNAQLNASLPSGGSVREVDSNGHGTHVTGIAAGNGTAGAGVQPAGTFVGLAPKADILFVKTDFSDAAILDGINYIVSRAASLGEKAVINLSLGQQIDPHDGTSAFDTAIAAVAANTPVVVAMGNDGTLGGAYPHSQAPSFIANQSITFGADVGAYSTAGTDAEFDFWKKSADGFSVSVTVGGIACGTVASGSGTSFSCDGQTVYVENADGAGVNGSGNELYVDVYNASGLPGTSGSPLSVSVKLTCANSGGCGLVDGFVDPEGEGVNFLSGAGYSLPSTLTLASPATANNVFAVGSYASKVSWTATDGVVYHYTDGQVAGLISNFSGWGPTRDGRKKPDVSAPGEGIGSAMSSNATIFATDQILQDNLHAILQGTSMATPVVTGILAARLQGGPTRTVSQLRAIIQGLARSDSAATASRALPNDAFGYGKVVSSPQPIAAPGGLTGTPIAGGTAITWSWSASLLGADSYDVFYATNNTQPLALGIQPAYTQTGLLPDAIYGVQVNGNGVGADGPGASITTATFALAPAGAPVATGYTSSASFTYSACPAFPDPSSCSGYAIEIAADSGFTTSVVSTATTNTGLLKLSTGTLSPNTPYFARLARLNPYGQPTYGPYTTFNTGGTLVPPVSPSFGGVSTGAVVFSWGQGTNPPGLTYVAEASTAADYTGTLLQQAVTSLSAAFGGLVSDTSYYFRAQGIGGPFLDAGPQATLASPPAVSTNPFPVVGADGFTLAWSSGSDQTDTLYQADVSPLPTFLSGLVSVLTRTPSAAFTGLTANTLYYARVTAIGRLGGTAGPVVLGSTVTLVQAPTSPAVSALGANSLSFSFAAANPPGTRYLVQVSTDAAFSAIRASSNTAAFGASFSGLLSNQPYFVEAAGINQVGSLSAFVSASTVTLAVAPLAAAVPVTTFTATSFGFAWAAGTLSPGTTYAAQISSSPAFDPGFVTASSVTFNLFASVSGLQPNTTYYGRVQAQPPSASTNPNGPYLVAAAGATLPNPPLAGATTPFMEVTFTSATVAWQPLPLSPSSTAAEGYLVQFSTAADFTTIAASSAVPPRASTASVSGLVYATAYFARVGAVNWEGAASYLALGSTVTALPPLSSGTVSGAGLSLSLPPAFPELTSIAIYVPPGAFPVGTSVTVLPSLGVVLDGARSNESSAITPLGTAVSVDLSAGGLQPAMPVRIMMGYDPSRLPAGADERRLMLWRLDPASGNWTLVPSQDDPVGHVLTAYTPHFSTFAPFFVAAGADVSSVRVFPQPWEIDDAASQYWSSVLTFSGLPASATVKIFTVTGELVWSGTAAASGVLAWNGSNRFGRRAASGTYYAAFQNGGQSKTRRLVIIR